MSKSVVLYVDESCAVAVHASDTIQVTREGETLRTWTGAELIELLTAPRVLWGVVSDGVLVRQGLTEADALDLAAQCRQGGAVAAAVKIAPDAPATLPPATDDRSPEPQPTPGDRTCVCGHPQSKHGAAFCDACVCGGFTAAPVGG